jgi:hypothetical protein
MNILIENGYAFRIAKTRYRCNCSKEWGLIVGGDTKKMSCSQAEKAGMTKGNYVEGALCWVDNKILTFEPNYIQEPFVEIWMLPTAGEIKEQFNEKASELSTFLIHRQSKDKMMNLIETFARDAFNSWVTDGMKGNADEYAANKASEVYFSKIFRFELVQTDGKFGTYFYVDITHRDPVSDLEKATLKVAKQIYEGHKGGLNYCYDQRIEDNHQKCMGLIAGDSEPSVVALPSNGKTLSLKGNK